MPDNGGNNMRRIGRIITAALLTVCMLCQSVWAAPSDNTDGLKLVRIRLTPEGSWMKEADFPDRLGRVDDTLAMNSMISFKGYKGQGKLYIQLDEGVTGFSMYVNEKKTDTSEAVEEGVYELDFSDISVNGMNTVQVTGIKPYGTRGKVHVKVPYPVITEGSLEDSGINKESLELIEDVIKSDVDSGFTSAQMAVIRNGKLVYENAWGKVNSYLPDGSLNEDSKDVTVDTLYDLASVTKMFAVNYALQKLVTDKEVGLDDKVAKYLGDRFYEDTLDFVYADVASDEAVSDIETQKKWKSQLTIRDLLRHQGGFPAGAKYNNRYYDAVTQELGEEYDNLLYAGSAGTQETKEATAEAICKTPLKYEPGTKTVYSDIDYMVLGLVVESATGKNLDEYIKETFCEPMGLTHITYRPLDNGFEKDDCAATEVNGNTRDNCVDFPGIRRDTIQGEAHDEAAYYSMGGMSGHAGLFANAGDLAKLASVMLTGGYDNNMFFSQNVIDMFTSPKSEDAANWGLGWYREGDDQRSWYFGTEAAGGTIGHQGWTGTLVMVDPTKDLVVVYLTNKINSLITDTEADLNKFEGGCYTASTLGFVPQLLSVGFDEDGLVNKDTGSQLTDLLEEMAIDSMKLVENARANDPEYPRVKNVLSKLNLYEKRARDINDDECIARAGELRDKWEQYKENAARTPEAVLYNMTLEEKIEQMIMPDIRTWGEGDDKTGVLELNDELKEALSEHDFAGYCLFSENISDAEQTKGLVDEINECSVKGKNSIGSLISIDQEGGRVTRLATGTQMPGNMALGAIGDPEASRETGKIIGEELSALGINVDFSPVADVNSNPSNPIIGIRSFSDDPDLVGNMVKGYVEGLHETGTISTLKHFPGHGDTDTDSHTGLPIIDKSIDELNENELVPYRAALESGYDMVMTAHIQYPKIEDETYKSLKDGSEILIPQTMSKKFITDILRGDIGFDGVVVSDALNMGAITHNFDRRDVARLGINAGLDIILMPVDMHTSQGNKDMERYINDIAAMVRDGRIEKKRIDESVLRVLKLKEKYGLLDDVYGNKKADLSEDSGETGTDVTDIVGSREHHEREWELAKKAVTLVKDDDILPLKDTNRVSVICPYNSQVMSVTYATDRLRDEGILDKAFEVEIIPSQDMDLSDPGVLVGKVDKDRDTVIVISALYNADELDPGNEKGAFSAAVDALIEDMHKRDGKVVILSAQLPYDLARYGEADALLACYNARGMTEMPDFTKPDRSQYGPNIPAALYTIFGGSKPSGRLPVNIPALDGNYKYKSEYAYKKGDGMVKSPAE